MMGGQRTSWRQGFWLDMGIAGAYTTLALLQLGLSPTFDGIVDPALVIFVLMQTAFLGLRRRYPLAVHLITSLGLALQANGYPLGVSTDATLITMYSVAAYGTWRGATIGVAATLADIYWVVSRNPEWGWWSLMTTYFLWLAIGGLGVFARLQQVEAERRTRQLTQLEQERQLFRQNAVAEERARMARELHDSVGHSVTGIVLLAGAVRDVEEEPEVMRDAVQAIERSGLDAMAELEALIGLLRDEDGGDGLARQPGLRNLDRLMDRASAVGLEVHTEIAQRELLPPSIDRAAFRIIQEALTNAAKYANPARVSVAVRPTEDCIEIEVVNPVLVEAGSSDLSGGRGLIGMDERVSILGGTFVAGPTGNGEFRVRAQLPVSTLR